MLEYSRIHLMGIGTQYNWIFDSLKKSKADKVYLFCKENEKNPDAIKAEKEVVKFFKKKEIDSVKIIYKDKDIFGLLKEIREIIEKEKDSFIHLNITSGEREVATSFTLASMLFRGIPKDLRLYSMYAGDFYKLPSFQVKLPEKSLVGAMRFISEQGNECVKKKLLTYCFDNKILKTDKDSEENKYMLLNRRIIDKLLGWKFIEIDGKGKGALVKLKEEGQILIKFL